jgi:nicotinamidase-related amidase
MLLKSDESQLLIVDVQERLLPAMADSAAVLKGCTILLEAAAKLGIPILVSEQYPKGLGHTVAEVAALAPNGGIREKIAFSCAADQGLAETLEARGRRQVVVAGIEAHVCVLQTAMMLREQGYEVFVAADAVSSRLPGSVDLALARLRQSGITVGNCEMVLFEWLGQAGTPEFKEISKLIR